MKILLTGFEAFGNLRANPSQQIVERMAERARQQGIPDLYPEILPTEYAGAGRRIRLFLHVAREYRVNRKLRALLPCPWPVAPQWP